MKSILLINFLFSLSVHASAVYNPSYSTGNSNPTYNSGSSNSNLPLIDFNADIPMNINTGKYTIIKQRPRPRPRPRPTNTQPSNEPKPSPTQPDNPSTPPSNNNGDRNKQMLCQVNAIRAQVGKKPLQMDSRLMNAAQLHSEDQATHKQMTHTGTKIANFFDRIEAAGFQCSGASENVAWNQQDITAVVQAWKNSPGHYQNMIGDYNCFGWGEQDLYWTQDFANGPQCDQANTIQC